MRAKHWSRVTALALVLVALTAFRGSAASQPAVAGSERLIVFYDPDANHKAILRITSLFNVYLSNIAPQWRFQPVHSRRAFEDLIRGERAALAIVSSTYLGEKGISRIKPLLVPSNQGDVRFRKLLVDTGGGSGRNLSGKRVAAAATAADSTRAAKAITEVLRAEKLNVASMIPIPVSKDIDALLAVSFGQADLALVTPMSIEVLKRINPAAARSLRVVFRTEPTLWPPLCVIGDRVGQADLDQLVNAFRAMHNDSVGKQAMRTLGFEKWAEYEQGML